MEVLVVILILVGLYFYVKNKKRGPSSLSPGSPNTSTANRRSSSPSAKSSAPSFEPFSLTINIEESVAEEFQSTLKRCVDMGTWQAAQELLPLVARYNVKCVEVDNYIREFKPVFLKEIEKQIAASSEWATASELDREDLLSEFRENAVLSLDVKPDCDIEVLFSVDDIDLTVDDGLIDRYGFPLAFFYLTKRQGVHIVPVDHYERKKFESLVEAGLVTRGEDIPAEQILEGLTIKNMMDIVSDLNPPKISRRAKAIEYILGIPDLKSRLAKTVSFRSLFYIKPLPEEFKDINLERVSVSWKYAREFTELICKTYASMHYTNQSMQSYLDREMGYKRFEISGAEDCCPHCQKMAGKKYHRDNLPTVPVHIGCRCTLEPVD